MVVIKKPTMKWFENNSFSWIQSFVIKILKSGTIPQHIAFIMDGNRRYANKINSEKIEGHVHGFQKLSKCLDWCLQLDVKEMTVYAFSLENFKRSQKEVDDLMQLIQEKLKLLLEEKEKIDKYGVCIRVLGDLSLLPEDIQKTIAEVVLYSSKNSSVFFNVCVAYTSQDEMSRAAEDIAEGVSKGLLLPEDIDEELFDQCLYNNSTPDIVIRTSGEVRLSDFLLWQSSYSLLSFVEVLWPEFSIWHLFASIWHYQHCLKHIQANHNKYLQSVKTSVSQENYNSAKASYSAIEREEIALLKEKIQEIISKCQERKKNFLQQLKTERIQKLQIKLHPINN